VSAARDWWSARTRRERTLLAIMFALASLVLAWLLVLRPLADALDAARTRHGLAVIALGEAKARAPTVGLGGVAGPIDSLVARTAAEAGFTNARIVGQGPARASVTIESARSQALFGWVAQIERQGARVERLVARVNPDRTLAVEMVVRAPSS